MPKTERNPLPLPTNSPASVTANTVKTTAEAVATAPSPSQTVRPVLVETTSTPPAIATRSTNLDGPTNTGLAGLSQDQMVQGLKDALGRGVQQAIERLGREGGFLSNVNVRIPMPDQLKKVETTLRSIKQEQLADEFVLTMNRAAEQAVPEAAAIFADAVHQMTIENARSILTGPNDAATQYFRRTTQTNLYVKFYPIVQKATQNTGVTAAYKSVIEKANVTKSLGSLGNPLGSSVLGTNSLDLDAYVTNKAMDGLFKMVAEEEAKIRQNPVARTTDILQKVFGGLTK
jgi:hypothetical protein